MGETEIIIFIILVSLIIIIFIIGTVAFVFQYRKRKMVYDHEKKVMKELHKTELLNTQVEMQQQTMQDIGREIHDNVGQKLTLASLYTQQLGYENKFPEINEQLTNIGTIINQSLADLRKLSKTLTQADNEKQDLTALLQNECRKVNDLKVCQVHFKSNMETFCVSSNVSNVVSRIVQEFVQNSLKHAACKNMFINFDKSNNGLTIIAADDGRGFDVSAVENDTSVNGIGLKNIKRRAELIGATLNLQSVPGKGTSLKLWLPL